MFDAYVSADSGTLNAWSMTPTFPPRVCGAQASYGSHAIEADVCGLGGPGHDKAGMLSTANAGPGTDNSQFFITFRATKDLDGKHTVFGELIKGEATLEKIEKLGTKDGPTTKPVVIEKATVVVK